MKKEELQKIQGVRMQAPTAPIRFTIDDELFEFNSLPFGILMLIEQIKSKLRINHSMLQVAPIAEWLIVSKQQTDDIRKIDCLLLGKGEFDMDKFNATNNYLREHCTVGDLCTLFIVGSVTQNLWLRDAWADTLPTNLEGVSESDLWNKPFVELLKK